MLKKYIHIIGIGGIGASSLAQILKNKGNIISGSDNTPSAITRSLKLSGIEVFYEHKADNISKKHQLIIYSPAIPENNPELMQAKKLKIKCQSYPEALGELTKEYFTVAVTGTHGKSTTTAMISLMAVKAKLDPTVVIGTKIREFGNKNYRVGKSNLLIIEACEYKRSFLHFHPDILIITNIEADHLDYYKDLKDYTSAFSEIAAKVPKIGTIIIDKKDKNSINAIEKNIKANVIKWEKTEPIKLKIPGKFNINNANFALQTAKVLNVPKQTAINSLKSYTGSWRRLEYKKTHLPKTIFIDDYGHHPTEIKETLKAIKEKYPNKKILCIYQPHQHNRTKHFLKDFGKSFFDANKVIIPDIYKVRDTEEDSQSVTTETLVSEISKHHKDVENGGGLKSTALYIKQNHKKFDVIVTMGAGNIDKIYNYL